MLKVNDWYYLPVGGKLGDNYNVEVLGTLAKIIEVHDTTLYVNTEEWWVTKDRKFIHKGMLNGVDSVMFTKFGKKVKAPPKVFEVLYSETVNKNLDTDQSLDTEDEYNED